MSSDRIAFQHELTRRAVEDSLPASHRIEMNQRVLAALTADAKPARLVHHAREAGAIDTILTQAPLAAVEAAEMGSHREAAAHYQLLEPHLDALAPGDRADILTAWARETWLLDHNSLANDLIEAALGLRRELNDPVLLSETLFLQSSIAWVRGDRSKAVSAVNEAVALLAETPHRRRYAYAISKQAQLVMLAADFDAAVEISDRALQLAAELDDPKTMAHSLINKGTAVSETDFELGLDLLARGQELAAKVGMGYEEARAAVNRAWCMVADRRLEASDAAWQEALEVSSRREIPTLERYSRAIGAWCLEQRGNWAAAEDIARELLASDLRSAPTDIMALTVLGAIEARRGRREARNTLTRAWELGSATEEVQRMAPVAAALAEYTYLTGDRDEALVRSLSEVLEQSYRTRLWFTGPIEYWLWRLGISSSPTPMPEPLQASMDGNVAAAAAAWTDIGSPYGRADALSQGDTAQRLEALEIFDDLGALAPAGLLRKVLRDRGVSIPRGPALATRKHAAGLTARQAEVLSLLAEGLSNLEIADRLFLSTRTVEHHVAAVISKLDVSTRDEAVEAASRQGLLPTS